MAKTSSKRQMAYLTHLLSRMLGVDHSVNLEKQSQAESQDKHGADYKPSFALKR